MSKITPEAARDELASVLKGFADHVDCYFWRLTGDEPNSLCHFLGLSEEQLTDLFRLCGVFQGDNNNLKKNNFEDLFRNRACLDWSQYKSIGMERPDYFIKIGKGKAILKPKSLYDKSGKLFVCPIDDLHMRKVQMGPVRAPLLKLLESSQQPDPSPVVEKKTVKHQTPMQALMGFIREEMVRAVKTNNPSLPTNKERKAKRLVKDIVDVHFQQLLNDLAAKMDMMESGEKDITPDRAASEVVLVTPPVPNNLTGAMEEEATEEEVVITPPTDDFIKQLQEEIHLQSMLHKRLFEKGERSFQLEHKNGHKMKVVLPPNTESPSAFVEEATRSQWVDAMLDTPDGQEGMLTYLAKKCPNIHRKVAKKKNVGVKVHLTTAQTLALAKVGNLNDARKKKVISFLRKIGKFNIDHKTKEIQRIGQEVGVDRTNQNVQCGSIVHEWAQVKGKETKPPEEMHFWNSSLSNEIEAEVDLYIAHLFKEKDINDIPKIGYTGDGFEKEGVTILIGGDHGDKNCPISAKINLSDPNERKRRNELNYQCPIVPFASVQCSKDAFEVLESTVMPTVRKQLNELKESAVVTACNKKNVRQYRSFVVPKTIRHVAFRDAEDDFNMTYAYNSPTAEEPPSAGSLQNLKTHFKDVKWFDLEAKATVPQFNELFIGDLAFLAMLLGMNNSAGDHCLICENTAKEFDCKHSDCVPRTKESLERRLEECLVELEKKKNNKTLPANVKGVNRKGLVQVDPQRIIVPTLHCPMGLVDKVLESFKRWAIMEVEDFKDDTETDEARSVYKLALKCHNTCVKTFKEAQQLHENNPDNQQARQMKDEASKSKTQARKQKTKAKEKFDERVKRHNAKKSSLSQQFEVIFRRNGIKREHYHGGKFNGVNCMRIMGNSEELFVGKEDKEGFLSRCLACKVDSVSDEQIRNKMGDFSKLFAILDTIWSKVRGIESGLLPTDNQKKELEKAVAAGKRQWKKMGPSTLQPKWHLTFDGHLEAQVKKFEGLADKADDSIEKFHQDLKTLRVRFRSIVSYERRERCIRRELRRKRSPSIKVEIDTYESLTKQTAGTKRKLEAQERQEAIRVAKKEKREAAIS